MENLLFYGILISMLPIGEVRLGIPVLIGSGIGVLNAFLISTICNIIIIPFIFFFLDSFHHSFMRVSIYRVIFNKFILSLRHKTHSAVEKYGFLGLLLFVAVPIPGSGAYAAIIGSWLLGIDRPKSLVSVSLGVIAAGIIVTLLSIGVLNIVY